MEDIAKNSLAEHGYILGEELGKGSYGKCYLVNSIKYRIPFACKYIQSKNLGEEKARKIRESWINEKNILIGIDHSQILKIYDFWENECGMFLIIEYCEGNSIKDMINRNRCIKEATLIQYAQQIASAISYLHSHGIVHHDIKPSNFLLDSFGNIKICDFGISKFYSYNENCKSRLGTLPFMSPELLKGISHDPFKDDIWAFGVSLYYMAFGRLPWEASDIQSLIYFQLSRPPRIGNQISPKFLNIMRSCICKDPSERPSIYTIDSQLSELSTITKSTSSLPCLKMTHLGMQQVKPGVFLYSIKSRITQTSRKIERPMSTKF